METSASEPLMTYRNGYDDVKTEGEPLSRDQSGGHLCLGQTASGIKAASTCNQAFVRNVGSCRRDDKGKAQAEDP